MEIFVGRQPILDTQGRTQAYELLFRSSRTNQAGVLAAETATQQVLSNTFFSLGIDSISAGLPVFVNFPRTLLLDATAVLLPAHSIVVEVLEDVAVDQALLEACRNLKNKGYRLAVDDYRGEGGRDELIALADFLKVDFRDTDILTRYEIQSRFQRKGLSLLAEKVETVEEFREAADMGYTLFQGYYFARPEVLSGVDVPALKSNAVRLLREVHAAEIDMAHVAQLIRIDVSLCRRLLRYMNSAAFAWHAPVVSVERALSNLGESGTRRWITMAVLPQLASGGADELIALALARAKFCEQASTRLGLGDQADQHFLMGLFSLLDAMLGQPLANALVDMPLSRDAKAALLGERCAETTDSLWQMAKACESADSDRAAELGEGTPLRPELTAQMWTNALRWSNEITSEMLSKTS